MRLKHLPERKGVGRHRPGGRRHEGEHVGDRRPPDHDARTMLHLHVPQQLEARERGTQSRTRDAEALGEDSLWGKTQAFRGCRHEGPHGVPRLVACGWPTPRRLVDWSDHLATLYIGSQRVNGLGASVEIERRAPRFVLQDPSALHRSGNHRCGSDDAYPFCEGPTAVFTQNYAHNVYVRVRYTI